MNAFHRQLVLADHPAVQGVQGVQQADGEGGTGPHAAAGRQIAVVMDLHAARHGEELQNLPDGRMADLVDRLAVLVLGVDHAEAMLEERRQVAAGQVAVLVDRRGNHRAAVLPIPRRIVGAAAEKGNPKRRSADNHGRFASWFAKKLSAAAYDSGVPMSRKRPSAGQPNNPRPIQPERPLAPATRRRWSGWSPEAGD